MYVYLIFLLIMSSITFCLYAADKKKAQKGQWRIPEATLLLASFLGGAIGGVWAMFLKRHKTRHWYFTVVNFLGLTWQFGLLMYWMINN
ncbi:MAG: DUF1294 domain-containing protein [Clostridia bacterium]|nr:DUF1294 domain-containing protein [Clostridia bacterium]